MTSLTTGRATRPASATAPSLARIAYQGVPGAFGEQAIRARWGEAAIADGRPSFAAVVGALLEGAVELAVIPIWNSSIGEIVAGRTALDAQRARIRVIDEVEVPVRHCLLARRGVRLADIRVVGSHPAALAQCRWWIAKLAFETHAVSNTAAAARDLRDGPGAPAPDAWYAMAGVDPRACAAIAGGEAGRRYGLTILAEGVQDAPDNRTRFAVVEAR